MSSSRAAILAAIRQHKPAATTPLPVNLAHQGLQFPNLATAFAQALSTAGGLVIPCADRTALRAELAKLCQARKSLAAFAPDFADFAQAASPDAITRPHDYEDLGVCILQPSLAVAENGAVWIPFPSGWQRSAPFLTQQIVLIVDPALIVPTMHQAYARIAQSPTPDCGTFIAGPSKTADIEQCLVIGAHGAIELVCLLLAPPPTP